MNGAEYIVEFLHQRKVQNVFLVTGGACAFIVDAIGRHGCLEYTCFQHEQAAAMAADAVWRVNRTVGVTVATSGPGATNLLTGIACSYFDSIPAMHITGQVNKAESAAYIDAQVRQAGFQETRIVEMAMPITKYAVQVNTVEELKQELIKAYQLATTGRMGPVLIDVPMDVQQADAGDTILWLGSSLENPEDSPERELNPQEETQAITSIQHLFSTSERPLVLFGAGVGLAGVEPAVMQWLETCQIPFVSSWNALTYFNHNATTYHGNIGVYGNRGANYILQNADAVLILGSRLDNRQRSGNPRSFAPQAHVHVVDIDAEELKKYTVEGYTCTQLDFKQLPAVLAQVAPPPLCAEWQAYLSKMKQAYFGQDISTFAKSKQTLSPYQVIQRINALIAQDAIVIADTGASLCWVYQSFHRTEHTLFTAGGMSPMGYSLPAAIGAALLEPGKQIICFIGDGGFQMNIQELQTLVHYGLDIKVVLLNNGGYGIIKQFQDSYLEGRYEASGRGYSVPNFQAVVQAYQLDYQLIQTLGDLTPELFNQPGARVIEVALDPATPIEPKLEMGRPIQDQFPYVSDQAFREANPWSAARSSYPA